MTLREFFSENFAGDLEYHPRRATLYLILGTIALSFWYFSSFGTTFAVIPLVFALGSLTLLVKGIFLLRKSSEGIGLSEQELAKLSDPTNRKSLPPISPQALKSSRISAQALYSSGPFSTSAETSTVPGVTRPVFTYFSQALFSSCSAGSFAA